ncbi:hypothetical protein [Rhizobium sp. 1399]|jgi:hypothetical protein|uniref:hypothetical protein n=1 Tax=unclassified Rhizobium TaxID=2613769 RepID=UPI0028570D25|nr:hypothetical protein [Rhizobium sp. 1399]MDR6667913.1 hypothetical protein [Rhizobium sp. 1399]
MTFSIEEQIEELRVELSNSVDPAERRQIIAELDLARAELNVAVAEQLGTIDTEPPF